MAANSDRPPAPPPAGWFADPAGSPYLRWWDGAGWTDNFIDARTGEPPAELSPARGPRGVIAAGSAPGGSATVASNGAQSATADSAAAHDASTEPSSPEGSATEASPPTPGSPDAPPLTRREARARERLAEQQRANGEVFPLIEPGGPASAATGTTAHGAESALAETTAAESTAAESTAAESTAAESTAAESTVVEEDVATFDAGFDGEEQYEAEPVPAHPESAASIDDLIAQPVSAVRSVDSLGVVSEPDAVAAPEDSVAEDGASAVGAVGSIGIPVPEWAPTESAPGDHGNDAVAMPPSNPSYPSNPSTPDRDGLFDFAGITPTGAGPVAPPPTSTNAWALPPAQSTADSFPLAVNDSPAEAPMSTRRSSAGVAADLPDAGVSTWAAWLFAALPVLHLALAAVVFGVLQPSDASVVRWPVLLGPIIVYLVLAGLDRATLVRAGHLDVAPVAFAIIPPLYLAIRVVRMGSAALAPLLVWVVLQAIVIAALIFALPQVWSALLGG